jgi:hypothetical protein
MIQYEHLEFRPGSNYRQLWVKGRHIRAEVLFRHTIGVEPRTAEEVADDYSLPIAVVREAVDYCVHHQPLLDAERNREALRLQDASEALGRLPDPAGR